MAAIASSGGIGPLTLPHCFSRIKPLISASSPNAFCKSFSSHLSCKNLHRNSTHVYSNAVADEVLAEIQNSGVIACLRTESAEGAIEAARAAIRGGIKVLEITMSTPSVFEVLQCLVQEYPSASFGVGTVLDRAAATDALRFGAKFLMSPVIVKEILDDVTEFQALYIPGAMTPTEILCASKAGARIVKVYPVSVLGGVPYIAAMKKLFPNIPMVASQGVTIDSVGEYIAQGASSVVLSDAVFEKKAMDEQNFDRINEIACRAAFLGSEASSGPFDETLIFCGTDQEEYTTKSTTKSSEHMNNSIEETRANPVKCKQFVAGLYPRNRSKP